MKNKKTTVLILGAQGMLGRVVFTYLKDIPSLVCIGTSRKMTKGLLQFNANDIPVAWNNLLNKAPKIDCVVNCIGLLRSYPNKKMPKISELAAINSGFPHFITAFKKTTGLQPVDELNADMSSSFRGNPASRGGEDVIEKKALKDNFKFMHISTDAVFSENTNHADENTPPNPTDNYGKSKLAGEVVDKNSLTIRTSIIGYDPKGKKGLIERVINSKDKMDGYINQKWSGATVLQVAELIEWLTVKKGFKKVKKHTSILHYAPLGPTTNYDLVNVIAEYNNKKFIVKKSQSVNEVRRFLVSKYKRLLPKYLLNNSIVHALKNLTKFEVKINKYGKK